MAVVKEQEKQKATRAEEPTVNMRNLIMAQSKLIIEMSRVIQWLLNFDEKVRRNYDSKHWRGLIEAHADHARILANIDND